jgi:hypothetical protein
MQLLVGPQRPASCRSAGVVDALQDVALKDWLMRTREGMAVARDKGELRGKKPKLTARQQRELVRMYGTRRAYSMADLAEVFTVSRQRWPHLSSTRPTQLGPVRVITCAFPRGLGC